MHRINGFSDFIHRLDSKGLEDKNTTFRKLDLFPSSCDPVSEALSSNSLESGWWTKSKNPLILCVIHHRQNPIESTRLIHTLDVLHQLILIQKTSLEPGSAMSSGKSVKPTLGSIRWGQGLTERNKTQLLKCVSLLTNKKTENDPM
jgi:hypothetical protein